MRKGTIPEHSSLLYILQSCSKSTTSLAGHYLSREYSLMKFCASRDTTISTLLSLHFNPLGPKRGYIRARRTTIGGYIRTLTMNAPLTGYRVATPTALLSTHTIATRSMADDVIEVQAAYSQLQTTIQVFCG